MRVRINITSLSADERSQYVKGIKLLKKETGIKTDLNSKPINTYDYYVDIHNDTVNHPSTPPKGTINDPDAAHRGPAFLPWHRAFLLQFEADLQRVLKDPSYSLPYWDWAADAALLDPKKALVWSNDFMGGDGNPVTSGPFKKGEWSIIDNPHLDKDGHLSADLYRAFEDNQYGKKLPTQEEVDQAMNVTPYDCSPWNSLSGTKPGTTSFRNTLEGFLPPPEQHTGLHNRVHLWVGGAMGPAASPNDPIFFLHHCNVDRLWAEWQEKHPNEKYLPESGGPKDHNLNDPMWSVNKTPASQLDHRKLGYVYDSGFSFTKDNDYIPYIVEKALMELDKDPVQSPKVPWPSAKPSDSYKWAAEWTHFTAILLTIFVVS